MSANTVKLTLVSIVKDIYGVYDVSVIINDNKEYTYSLKSEYDVNEFRRLCEHTPGKALNWLKNNCIKEE